MRAQYLAVLDGLTLQLTAAGASWTDVVFRRMYTVDVPSFMNVMRDLEVRAKHPWNKGSPSPSTLIGVTALSNPGFLIGVEIAAVVSD